MPRIFTFRRLSSLPSSLYLTHEKFSDERKSLLGSVFAICSGGVAVNQFLTNQQYRALETKVDAMNSKVDVALLECKATRELVERRLEVMERRMEVMERRLEAIHTTLQRATDVKNK